MITRCDFTQHAYEYIRKNYTYVVKKNVLENEKSMYNIIDNYSSGKGDWNNNNLL